MKKNPTAKASKASTESCDSVAHVAQEVGKFLREANQRHEEGGSLIQGFDPGGMLYSLEGVQQTFPRLKELGTAIDVHLEKARGARCAEGEVKPPMELFEEMILIEALRYLEKEWRPGYEPYDLVVVHSAEAPEEEKQAALERLANTLGRQPIAPQRWKAFRSFFLQALEEEANLHCRLTTEELQSRVLSSLWLAVGEVGPETPGGAVQSVRRLLNEQVTEDFLGPGWRKAEASLEEEMMAANRLEKN